MQQIRRFIACLCHGFLSDWNSGHKHQCGMQAKRYFQSRGYVPRLFMSLWCRIVSGIDVPELWRESVMQQAK